MAERKTAKKGVEKPVSRTTVSGTASKGFSAEERAAMKERVKEQKSGGQGGWGK
jgi:hypothetical protein